MPGVFHHKEGKDAVEHLFYLTSGLKSQILAEDQIITQVKDALTLSRDAYCTDGVLEVLFRMAVTAAKKVKTEVAFQEPIPLSSTRPLTVWKTRDFPFRAKPVWSSETVRWESDGTGSERGRGGCDRYSPPVPERYGDHSPGM